MHRLVLIVVLAHLRAVLRLIATFLMLLRQELGVAVLVPWLGQALLRLRVKQLRPTELLGRYQHVL